MARKRTKATRKGPKTIRMPAPSLGDVALEFARFIVSVAETPTDDCRTIEIRTRGTWPTKAELALRTIVERAIAASDVAEVLGTDAGRGSVSVWVRLKKPSRKRSAR